MPKKSPAVLKGENATAYRKKAGSQMDTFLVDYLNSGNALLLVGSGPSNAMGYPSWKGLASHAIRVFRDECMSKPTDAIQHAFDAGDFPSVFSLVATQLGLDRTRQALNDILKPTGALIDNTPYKMMARWPIRAYMTTNYDDELQKALADIGEAYLPYGNSEDHLSYLDAQTAGCIFKLHGDLRSESGLILTKEQYHEIVSGAQYEYWRTKLTSIFQMCPVIVIGHSLTDPNIRHVLEAAKKGAKVQTPVCWLAPHISTKDRVKYLEKYRVRVIPYDNSDGKHSGLTRLIRVINDFVPPRPSVRMTREIQEMCRTPLGEASGAPGFFVFNKLLEHTDIEQKREDAVCATLQASLATLKGMGEFRLAEALETIGWPSEFTADDAQIRFVGKVGTDRGILDSCAAGYKVREEAIAASNKLTAAFEHLRNRFLTSLSNRIQREWPEMDLPTAGDMAKRIEASLIGFFREAGLTLASAIFSQSQNAQRKVLPTSVVSFLSQASAQYDDIMHRHAFFGATVSAFNDSTDAERAYLGRLSQGFFALHALGLFGDEAASRITTAKGTVWLVDSDSLIPLLALGAPSNAAFGQCYSRLSAMGVRFFCTTSIAEEAQYHLDFASELIEINGPGSSMVMAGAEGDAPYSRSNRFLQGFLAWQASGNPCDWESYMFAIFGTRIPGPDNVNTTLGRLGVQVVDIADWPGFQEFDYSIRDENTGKIAGLSQTYTQIDETEELLEMTSIYRKAKPEADNLLIVVKERSGQYGILKENTRSPAYFISHTSILNLVGKPPSITWQPESFMRYAATLFPVNSEEEAADKSFELLLWQLAQAGVSVLENRIVETVFSRIIDHAKLRADEQMDLYQNTISEKYGESQDAVLARLRPTQRPMAGMQLAHEIAAREAERRGKAEEVASEAVKRAKKAEKTADELSRLKRNLDSRKAKAQKNKRRAASGSKKKKKGKRR